MRTIATIYRWIVAEYWLPVKRVNLYVEEWEKIKKRRRIYPHFTLFDMISYIVLAILLGYTLYGVMTLIQYLRL